MDFNIEVRKKQLQSLDQYITSSKDKVQSILEYLGWNSKYILENEVKVSCSLNSRHKVPPRVIEDHLNTCYLKTAGYNIDDDFLSIPSQNSASVIKLDNARKMEILSRARCSNQKFRTAWNGHDPDPMTANRLSSTFSPDERLILYDYCVKNTEPPPTPSEFNINIDDKKEEKLLTQEELLAKERDAKRRRVKYKSVHTGRNKSHTEILKEVIENQMDLYKEYLNRNIESDTHSAKIEQNCDQVLGNDYITNNINDYTIKSEDIERPHSSFSRHSTHSNSSRSKRDFNTYESNNDEHKSKYLEYNKKHKHDEKYKYSPYREKEKKYRQHRQDSKHYLKDRSDWYYKQERRH